MILYFFRFFPAPPMCPLIFFFFYVDKTDETKGNIKGKFVKEEMENIFEWIDGWSQKIDVDADNLENPQLGTDYVIYSYLHQLERS